MQTYKVVDIKCPGCGAQCELNNENCKYCGNKLIITSFSSVYDMSIPEARKYAQTYEQTIAHAPNNEELYHSLGMCYLKIKQFDKAFLNFEKAIEANFDSSELYFMASISLLKGKKAFLTPKKNIDKAIELLEVAKSIENRGIYDYFLAYIKYDFFERKSLNISPSYIEDLYNSKVNHVTNGDIHTLFDLLQVSKPHVF